MLGLKVAAISVWQNYFQFIVNVNHLNLIR